MVSIATWIRECDEHWFREVFAGHPDISIHNARLAVVEPAGIDALMLTGGGDISLPFLRQQVAAPSLIVETDPARDEWEFRALHETLAAGKPLLAICRGLQVVNVAMGGTLHLDIADHDFAEPGSTHSLRYGWAAVHRFEAVNSSHHQALDRLADGIDVEAWSASDDVVEQVRLRGYRFALGVQYHPERHSLYRALFDDFFATVRGLSR